MIKRKKLNGMAAVFLSFCFAVCLAACGSGAGTGSTAGSAAGAAEEKAKGGSGPKIVATIFPEYDWVLNILGENPADAEVTLLLDKGTDLHSYQPTADDILKVSACDLFIYVGGESDGWAEDALREAVNKDMTVVNLLQALGDHVKEEEVVEGMQEEDHDHAHEEDHAQEEDHDQEHREDGAEYDEHVWLSLRNADVLVGTIAEAVASVDSANAELYRANAENYQKKLSTLDEAYKAAVSKAGVRTLLFGDRFPFRYLTDDYGLSYYAAFSECSAETEASFETVTFLSAKVDELSLGSVLTIEGTDHRIAETIVQNTGTKDQKILTMNSMQGTSMKDVQAGTTYLSIMEDNLAVLREALKGKL